MKASARIPVKDPVHSAPQALRDSKRASEHVLLTVYRRLLAHYGPQHWWPGETPFEMMVGAILTQAAAWQNVEKAIRNLKQAEALSPSALRRLPLQDIARLIHPSGYYNAKARKLKAFVEWLDSACGAHPRKLIELDTSALRKELLNVHGIGPETADSILLYAAQKPIFVIDAYTFRIVSRLGLAPRLTRYDELQRFFMANLPADTHLFNEYHALLVRLGKTCSRKRPACAACPLFDICLQTEAK